MNLGPAGDVYADSQWVCPGKSDQPLSYQSHMIPMVKTAYGWRAVCRQHERTFTFVAGEVAPREEPYGGGMTHNAQS